MFSFFIADLHLDVSKSVEPYLNFINFLDDIHDECDTLYILGDFFTYWYEHEGVDFYSKNPALAALKEFSDSGKKINYIYGNRDFAAGRFLQEYSGADFLGEEMELQTSGGRVYLTHGDRFAKKDFRYAMWRWMIRSRLSSSIFRNLPVGYAIKLADSFKQVGKKRPPMKTQLVEVMLESAKEFMEKGYDTVIMGHAHQNIAVEHGGPSKKKKIFVLDEFKYPGEFLVLEENKFSYRSVG